MFWLFVGPTGVYLLDFFCSGIQLYVLLSPYLCFVSFLYIDLYILGNNALIRKGNFMQTNINVSWSTFELRVSLAPWNRFPRQYFFCGSFVLFMSCVCHAFASVHCCLMVTCWEKADLLFVFHCVFVTFPCGNLGQVWYLIVLIPDFCRLSYFVFRFTYINRKTQVW